MCLVYTCSLKGGQGHLASNIHQTTSTQSGVLHLLTESHCDAMVVVWPQNGFGHHQKCKYWKSCWHCLSLHIYLLLLFDDLSLKCDISARNTGVSEKPSAWLGTQLKKIDAP